MMLVAEPRGIARLAPATDPCACEPPALQGERRDNRLFTTFRSVFTTYDNRFRGYRGRRIDFRLAAWRVRVNGLPVLL
jgi:hypothetical protein